MENNEFKLRKEEMLNEIEEVLEDINLLAARVIDMKFNLINCKTYNDYLKYYPNNVDLEENLKRIRLF